MSSAIGPGRRRVLRVLLVAACALALWGLLLVAGGGFDVHLAGVRVRSNNPSRLLIGAAVLVVAFVALGGRVRLPIAPATRRLRGFLARIVAHPRLMVAAVAIATAAVGVGYGARAAGGSDAYGYISQADLWLNGDLKVPQPWAADVPWTAKLQSFAPLGYRPAPGTGEWALVPVYSPGVPMMLAFAKALIGDWGIYLVIPAFGALAVVAAYRFGRRLASPWVAVGGAWLVATTPPAVAVLMEPLTDVPAMAMWTLSVTAILGRGRTAMAAAGVLAAAAILIRPNLAILLGPLALWPLLRREDGPRTALGSRITEAAVFCLSAAPGAIFIAFLANYLYGSPFESGYGPASYLYSWSRVLPNLPRYFGWYVEAHTPIAVLGMIAMVLPFRWIWPDAPDRRIFLIMVLFNVALWGLYASYFEYDSWGFLRFLLPGWPLLMLGTVATVVAIGRAAAGPTLAASTVAAFVVTVLGLWQIAFSDRQGMFNQRESARHEIEIARLVKAHTPANTVVMTIQRSGSLRYYSGRVTLRYDYLDPSTLDRDVAWLASRGVSSYALLDTHEVEEFRRKFNGQTAGVLASPILSYASGALRLFNLTPGASLPDPVRVDFLPPERFDVVPPEPQPRIRLRDASSR